MKFLIAFFLLSSCASLTHESRHQNVLIASLPPGAKILVDGEEVGRTPSYVSFRRGKHPQYAIVTPNETQNISLGVDYDWKSFCKNFLFLTYAPIGWIVDWATGAAWKIEDPDPVKLAKPFRYDEQKLDKIAIAPPIAPNVKVSDQAAEIWAHQLPLIYKETKLLPYQQTVGQFTANYFDFDESPDQDDRNKLYRELGITKIFESKVIESDDGDLVLKGHTTDAFTGKESKDEEFRISEKDLSEMQVTSWSRRTGWIHLVPNTLGIDISTNSTGVDTADGATHVAQPAPGASSFEKALYYLGSIDITRQNPPREMGSSRFRVQIVPNLFITNQRLNFPDVTLISQTTFHYFQASAGLGGEIGWQKAKHYLYLNVIPMFGYQYVSWEDENLDHSFSLGGFVLRSEAGYRYYLNRQWSVRLFEKTTRSYTNLWDSVIHKLAPASQKISSGYDISAGLAVAYTFDFTPDIRWKKQ